MAKWIAICSTWACEGVTGRFFWPWTT